MKRGPFLKGILASLVALFTFKPIKATEVDEYDWTSEHMVLWPNSAQFPCEKNSSFADRECASCRLVYNGRVKDSDPIRYKQVRVSQMTGKWYWEGDASTWEEFDDRVANKIFGRLSNQQ